MYKKTEKVIIEPWHWTTFWKPAVVEEVTKHHLQMIYLGEDGLKTETGWNCPTEQPIKVLLDDITKQIKDQDHEIMDRAFEDAVANLGRKK